MKLKTRRFGLLFALLLALAAAGCSSDKSESYNPADKVETTLNKGSARMDAYLDAYERFIVKCEAFASGGSMNEIEAQALASEQRTIYNTYQELSSTLTPDDVTQAQRERNDALVQRLMKLGGN